MRFGRFDLNLLVALDALIEDRSVSVAARRLFLSQPALSGALNRLREYFGDELLVPSGRQMMLTPRAEELRAPVREALTLIKSRIATPLDFDPATAERQFTIVASDYAYDVLVADTLAYAAKVAPGLSFVIEPTGNLSIDRLDKGEIDLFLTLTNHMLDNHPRIPLFEDRHVVISWDGAPYPADITEEMYRAAPHAVVFFGRERFPAFTETHLARLKIDRKIAVAVPTFSALPHAVVGTDRLATLYRRHAEFFTQHLPVRIHEPPLSLPTIEESVQWHSLRSSDQGLQWVVALLQSRAQAMTQPTDDPHGEPTS